MCWEHCIPIAHTWGFWVICVSSPSHVCHTVNPTSAGAAMQMVEELTMAVLMSVGFAVPVFYACQMQGSFFVFWLSWLISLADGIGEQSCFLGL